MEPEKDVCAQVIALLSSEGIPQRAEDVSPETLVEPQPLRQIGADDVTLKTVDTRPKVEDIRPKAHDVSANLDEETENGPTASLQPYPVMLVASGTFMFMLSGRLPDTWVAKALTGISVIYFLWGISRLFANHCGHENVNTWIQTTFRRISRVARS